MKKKEFVSEVRKIANGRDFDSNRHILDSIKGDNRITFIYLLNLGYTIEKASMAIPMLREIGYMSALTRDVVIALIPYFASVILLRNK